MDTSRRPSVCECFGVWARSITTHPAGQEFSGHWWVTGRLFGKQYNVNGPDEHQSEVLVAWGWNGMMSHQMPQARKVLKDFSKDPDRMLVSIDPRRSETAAIADIHLPVRPGTDALLMKAMIAIIVDQGWEAKAYIERHVEGWDKIRPWFEGFDARAAIGVCGLDYDQVYELCRMMTTRRWSSHPDLGIYMGRRSTLNSYFFHILLAICGMFCVRGGNVIPGMVLPMGFHADERDPKTWRTVATNMPPAAAGSFPPNVMPEEIMADGPDRLRAVHISACNPLRAYADTTAYEKAFSRLDLLVVNDIVMSETARLAHYVLALPHLLRILGRDPLSVDLSGHFFPDAAARRRSAGTVPGGGSDLYEAGRPAGLDPRYSRRAYGRGQGRPAGLWGKAHGMGRKGAQSPAQHAVCSGQNPGPGVGQRGAGRPLGHADDRAQGTPGAYGPGGVRTGPRSGRPHLPGHSGPSPRAMGRTGGRDRQLLPVYARPPERSKLHIPELEEEAAGLDAASEAADLKMPADYPLILNAGRHMDFNANTLMRNPEWNKGKRACTVAVSPEDAKAMGFVDGQQVKVTTEAASETGELQVTDQVRPGTVLIPHGFGLIYGQEVYGINVNRLTKNTHRDPIGTPLHRYVPCRVEAV